ncbi:MAG: branched-chain amino acid ABC transporter permease [Deltaproteobacteria bacterium]|nr:MAG: branched-chain amino acid ABC transporter permease [Deltaproteobacteria bacterium]
MRRKDRTYPILVGLFLLFSGAVFFTPRWFSFLLTVAVARSLVVLGVVLLMRAGLVSFGQGFFYCIGGYVAGFSSNAFGVTDAGAVVILAALGAVVAGAIVGLLLCNYRDIFFAMLTLALSMILYSVIVKNPALGGSDGFNVPPPTILGISPEAVDPRVSLPLFTFAVAFLLYALAHRYFLSGFGYAGLALRMNEIRLEYLSLSARALVFLKYILAGVLASVGGALIAYISGHVDPELAYWTTSGEFVFIALLGGTGHVLAPLAGGVVFEVIRSYAFDLAPSLWQMVLGVILLLMIIFMPEGLWSLTERFLERKRDEAAP